MISKILPKGWVKKILLFGFLIIFLFLFHIYDTSAPVNTIYAPGFSFVKLRTISKGMSPKEVKDILGEPFLENIEANSYNRVMTPYTCFRYSKVNSHKPLIPAMFGMYSRSWYDYYVCFDDQSKVYSVGRNDF